MPARNRLLSWLEFRIYRLHLHLDLELVRRWKWRRCLARGRSVLEVGPGGGPWTLELLRRGNSVTAIDVDLPGLRRLKDKVERFPLRTKRVRAVACRAADYSSRERYDQVILFDVLEHILDDRRTIENLARHLVPGGEILISVPRIEHIPIPGEVVSAQEDGRHVRKGYSLRRLEALLAAAGLTVTRRETACGRFTRGLKAFSNRVYHRTGSAFLFHLARILARPLIRLDFLRPGYPPYSLFLIASRRSPPYPR